MNKQQLSLRLSVSAGKSPHRGYPGAVTQELYGAIAKAISRRGGETRSKEQTAIFSASQRLRGKIAPIAATRVAVTQEFYGAIAKGNFYLAVPSWCSVVPGWG